MRLARVLVFFFGLIAAIGIGAYLLAVSGNAQTANPLLRPDIKRALKSKLRSGAQGRNDSLRPLKAVPERGLRPRSTKTEIGAKRIARPVSNDEILANAPISAGTPLSRVLHSAQISMTSTAGTDEQYVDRTNDLVADDRTTFDSAGGSFDIAVGRSGARYEVYSATNNDVLVGVLVVALDTNGDYVANVSTTFDLERDFDLPSAAAVVSGNGSDGREFVIVSSSGYFNFDDPNDPFNEPSPGVVLLIRDPTTNGFDTTQSRTLVTVGNDRLFNANALALMPNNDLLIADFASNELRIIRDTNGDRIPDTLDDTPYYSYQFSDDAPIDIAVNSRGLVFSHSEGNDTLMLAVYDDNNDGRGDHDEVVVEGLSIDNNLFLHGMTIDRKGTVYVIEDASSTADGGGGNGGTARIDAFADPHQDGFLENGKIFTIADADDLGLTGLSFGPADNQVANTEVFVRQHYLDFLNREPDPSGFAFWVNNIESCGADTQCREVKRIDTSAAFFLSIEFQQTGYFVERVYKAAYGDGTGNSTLGGAHMLPVPIVRLSEFLHDKQQIAEGVVVGPPGGPWEALLNNNKNLYVADFVQRSRFTTEFPAGMSAGAFVDKLNTRATDPITHVLPLSTAERNQLEADLTNGTKTRAQVLRAVVEDTEFESAELSRAFVLTQYFGYLRRNPNDTPDADYTGYDFWLKKLNDFGGDFRAAEMVKAFILSGEYRERFE